MNRNHLLYPLSAALAATLALSACKKPEPVTPPTPAATTPAPAPIEAPAAAASVVSVDLGNSVGADNRVAATATTSMLERAMAAGTHLVMIKPVTPSALMSHIAWLQRDDRLLSLGQEGRYEIDGV